MTLCVGRRVVRLKRQDRPGRHVPSRDDPEVSMLEDDDITTGDGGADGGAEPGPEGPADGGAGTGDGGADGGAEPGPEGPGDSGA